MKRTPQRHGLLATALAALLTFSTTFGCGGYGKVSPVANDYAAALYSIANGKAEDRLEKASAQIQLASQAGELSPQETQWLESIIADARSGQWETAAEACRSMMKDQTGE